MRDRLVFVPHELRQRAEEVVLVDDDLVRVRPIARAHLTRVLELAERPLLERDRKGLRAAGRSCRPSTQQSRCCRGPPDRNMPERHIGHQPRAHRVFEPLPEALDGLPVRELAPCADRDPRRARPTTASS